MNSNLTEVGVYAPSVLVSPPRRTPLAVAVGLALTAGMPAALAAAPAPGGALAADFQVNTYTSGKQKDTVIARDAAGDFVVVWESKDQAGSASFYDIYMQRYHADGSSVGTETRVNTTISDSQGFPSVAMDAAGDFVVVWKSDSQTVPGSFNIYGRLYKADGTPTSSEIRIDTIGETVTASEFSPHVAMDAAGDFAVVWGDDTGIDDDILARRFQADGTPIDATAFLVNTNNTAGDQYNPAVAMDAAGDFVAVWQDEATTSIDGRRFTLTGDLAAATAFQISTNTFYNEYAYVDMDAGGDFVVGWDASYYSDPAATVITYNLYVRRYDKQGVALDSSEVEIYSEASGSAYVLDVAMDAEGDYVVESGNYYALDGNGYGVFGQLFQADGTLIPPAQPVTGHPSMFQVNTTTAGNQSYSSGVAMDANGDFVVAWTDWSSNDGDGYGVFARRFAGPQLTDLAAALTAPSGAVETGGSFDLTARISNAVASTGVAQIDNNAALANGIALAVTVPKGAAFASASGTDWTCGTVTSGTLTCDYSGTLGSGAKAPALTLSWTAPSSAGELAFGATVSVDQTDTAAGNDTATAGVTVKAPSGGDTGSGDTGGSGPPPAASPSGDSGGGGALGWLGLGLLGLVGLRRRRRSI